jgi:ferritin-like metal-binding protein YciE
MKSHIHTLQDTLAFQLQGLYFAERKIKEEFEVPNRELTSQRLKDEMFKTIVGAGDRLLKLERIFNYMMLEPEGRKNKAVIKLLEETQELMDFTDSPHLKDILMVSCLQNLNAYKISSLKSAYMFTVELEMDTASDLLQQILESELETAKALSSLAIEEFNKGQEMAAA